MPVRVTRGTMGEDGPLVPGSVIPDGRFADYLVARGRGERVAVADEGHGDPPPAPAVDVPLAAVDGKLAAHKRRR